jgi:ATP-dependent Clp protease ATP-binding subunit ClpC
MFERLTPSARNVIVQAQREARALKHPQVGSAHLLLGVMGQPDESVNQTLELHAVEIEAVRERVKETVNVGEEAPEANAHIPFSAAAKEALAQSLQEALQLGHDQIGPEHLTLGLLRGDSDAVRVLSDLRVDIENLERDIRQGLA